MFNFKEFQENVQMRVSEFLPEELKNVEVISNEVTKNNGIKLHSITIKKHDSNIAPNIYIDDYFKLYEEGGDLDLIIRQISRTAMEHINAPDEFASIERNFMNFDFVKDKIIMVAVNAEKNAEFLANAPHQCREDLALIYKVMLGSTHGIATIKIKNEHLSFWGVTAEEIHELAMKNTRELLPVKIRSMNEIMKEMFAGDGMLDEMYEDIPLYQQMFVITNETMTNGAASIFYEDSLADLSNRIGSDLYILPSSIHECIAVSTDMGNPKEFAEIVRQVNGTEVSAEEYLSDHVYLFKQGKLSLADTTM